MATRGISNDITSLINRRYRSMNAAAMQGAMMRMASGYRINRAADDPAGLIAGTSLSAALAAIEAETRMNERAYHQATVADGALGEVSDMLIQAKSLAAANANESALSPEEKEANQLQIDSILNSIDRIGSSATFAGTKLLDGHFALHASGETVRLDRIASTNLGRVQISDENRTLSDVRSGGALDTSAGNVAGAMKSIDAAIRQVANMRGRIGAFQRNTVDTRLNGLAVAFENVSSANSLIMDADMATETSRLIRAQLLEKSLTRVSQINDRSRQHMVRLLSWP